MQEGTTAVGSATVASTTLTGRTAFDFAGCGARFTRVGAELNLRFMPISLQGPPTLGGVAYGQLFFRVVVGPGGPYKRRMAGLVSQYPKWV
jgi:hypothetical protein